MRRKLGANGRKRSNAQLPPVLRPSGHEMSKYLFVYDGSYKQRMLNEFLHGLPTRVLAHYFDCYLPAALVPPRALT